MNVTRAVLPVMRKQRSGNVVTISSTAGIVGQEFCSAYAAAKFGVEGWMESLRFEVEPFGIHTTIVEPGFFRTELLTKESTAYAELSIDDYAERTAQTRPAWEAMSGKQGGDPAKLAKALVTVVDQEQPPLRWVAGADAVADRRAEGATSCSRRSMPTATCRRRSRSTSRKRPPSARSELSPRLSPRQRIHLVEHVDQPASELGVLHFRDPPVAEHARPGHGRFRPDRRSARFGRALAG